MPKIRSLPARIMHFLAAGVLATGLVAPAQAIEPWIGAVVIDHSVPACNEGVVLDTIRSKLLTADAEVLKRGLAVAAVDHIHQTFEGTWLKSPVVRRYCEAKVLLNDGKHTTLYYLLEQHAGFAGASWNVEYCMLGLEPWRVHDGRCHTVRYRWW